MHRVELKEYTPLLQIATSERVPNAPCGVESSDTPFQRKEWRIVPNAPCGVERHRVRFLLR